MDRFFKHPLVFRSTELDNTIDFDQCLDFSKGYEVGLLEAHTDYRSSNQLFYLRLTASAHGTVNIRVPSHSVRSVEDFLELINLNAAMFDLNGTYTPMQDVVSVARLDGDKIQFSLVNESKDDSVQIWPMNLYTRENLIGVDGHLDGLLSKDRPNKVYDMSRFRDTVNFMEVHLPGFMEKEQALDVIPLSGEQIYNMHYQPQWIVYKPVKRKAFTHIPVHMELSCEEDQTNCTQLKQATLILHIRKQGNESSDSE